MGNDGKPLPSEKSPGAAKSGRRDRASRRRGADERQQEWFPPSRNKSVPLLFGSVRALSARAEPNFCTRRIARKKHKKRLHGDLKPREAFSLSAIGSNKSNIFSTPEVRSENNLKFLPIGRDFIANDSVKLFACGNRSVQLIFIALFHQRTKT